MEAYSLLNTIISYEAQTSAIQAMSRLVFLLNVRSWLLAMLATNVI
ncbi:hypothetical protein [Vibrio gallaecicus]|nr:hypothetical protein [Vibrio gallaecicus]MDN3617625.1 hypothetical protein [Vibrio gallaecicus]